jgi:hypothetical protein
MEKILIALLLASATAAQADDPLRREALGVFGRLQATVEAIVAFLDSLTGEVPESFAPPGKRPAL